MALVTSHSATCTRGAESYTVTVDCLRLEGQPVTGEGLTRELATRAAKRELARVLHLDINTLILIVSGDK